MFSAYAVNTPQRQKRRALYGIHLATNFTVVTGNADICSASSNKTTTNG